VAVSGGSDSDIVLDICQKVDKNNKTQYIWCNTGLEYEATKEHIKYLEDKYDVDIQELKPIKTIPACCKEYGQPFLSKYISECITRLQRHGFQWEDDTFDNLKEKYPGTISALKWWCKALIDDKDPKYEDAKQYVPKTFTVFDTKTGEEAVPYEIALREDWARDLMYIGMRGFAILENGKLILTDECGKFDFCPDGRFEVKWDVRESD